MALATFSLANTTLVHQIVFSFANPIFPGQLHFGSPSKKNRKKTGVGCRGELLPVTYILLPWHVTKE